LKEKLKHKNNLSEIDPDYKKYKTCGNKSCPYAHEALYLDIYDKSERIRNMEDAAEVYQKNI
jgi:hypothetical protein